MTATPENTFDPHEAARQVILSSAEDIDYCGIGEQFGDDWKAEGLTEAERDARQHHVHDLATSATVTVTWPKDGA